MWWSSPLLRLTPRSSFALLHRVQFTKKKIKWVSRAELERPLFCFFETGEEEEEEEEEEVWALLLSSVVIINPFFFSYSPFLFLSHNQTAAAAAVDSL